MTSKSASLDVLQRAWFGGVLRDAAEPRAHCERAFAQVTTPQPDAVADRRHPRARR